MSVPVKAGDVLSGKYEVERLLGAGGMGFVVAAKHLQLGEPIAIKFLLPDALKEEGIVARFLREARASAKIRSEHVARVYDVGTLDSGVPYIVMEYLEGSDIDALLERGGPLPVETAAEYILQACEALAEAHAIGIVHRDIKPANLFLTKHRDGSPVVKVIDFGISKIVAGVGEDAALTKTAEVRGSLHFMSPEQMSNPREVDARCDIWALGVSLYTMLTGVFPFQAETVPQLCGKIFHDPPVPLRGQRPDVPPGLEAVVLRCLAKPPQQRYASVAELAAALVEFAPPLAQLSAIRIARILGAPVPSIPGRASAHSMPAIDVTPASGGARSGDAQPGAVTPLHSEASRWSPTERSPSKSSRVAMITAGSALIALSAAIAVFVWMTRRDGAVAPEPPPVAVTAPEAAAPQPTPGPSVDLASAVLPASAPLPAPTQEAVPSTAPAARAPTPSAAQGRSSAPAPQAKPLKAAGAGALTSKPRNNGMELFDTTK